MFYYARESLMELNSNIQTNCNRYSILNSNPFVHLVVVNDLFKSKYIDERKVQID